MSPISKLLAAVILGVVLLSTSPASAEEEKFRYKFPCYYPAACWVTQLAHGDGNALDFDPVESQDVV